MEHKTTGFFTAVSLIIWAMTMLVSALILKDSDYFAPVQHLLILGAVLHLILIWVVPKILIKKHGIDPTK